MAQPRWGVPLGATLAMAIDAAAISYESGSLGSGTMTRRRARAMVGTLRVAEAMLGLAVLPMFGTLCRLSPEEIASIERGGPKAIRTFLFGSEEEPGGASADRRRSYQLDQLWDLLTFVLTGVNFDEDKGEPASLLGFMQDDRVGEAFGLELTYGPLRLLRPEVVGAIVEALEAPSEDIIQARLRSEGDPRGLSARRNL